MSIELARKYAAATDEMFKTESRSSLVTNQNYDWTGAHSIKIYKISTAAMNDYRRNVTESTVNGAEVLSRYGQLLDLSATTEELVLERDRSFIFSVDKLDSDETSGQLNGASALARQLREVVIPEVDRYIYGKMAAGAGNANEAALTKNNIYSLILNGSRIMDEAEVPDIERVLVVTPSTYALLKQAVEFDHTDVGNNLKLSGVIGMLDGMYVVRVPSSMLPERLGFMIAHPSATVLAKKLEDYSIHDDTPLASGSVVTGRICYGAYILDNKKDGIYTNFLPED